MRLLTCLPVLLLFGCATAETAPRTSTGGPPAIKVSRSEALAVGKMVWKNECGGTVNGLTSWNKGEGFASLGIGHFIWYSKGFDGPFDESWPKLIGFMKSKRVPMPRWVAETRYCPWSSRDAFMREFNGPRLKELRKFLADTVPVQAEFLVLRLEHALPKMLNHLPPNAREPVRRRFYAVAGAPGGLAAMIDYVNFKGEGTHPRERYNGQGWGLLQVLQGMHGFPAGRQALAEFSASGKRVLARRVSNARPKGSEDKWLRGWHNRCGGYLR